MKEDRRLNNKVTRVLSLKDGRLLERRWKEVKMGDIVEIRKDELFPADLLLLHAEHHDGN